MKNNILFEKKKKKIYKIKLKKNLKKIFNFN